MDDDIRTKEDDRAHRAFWRTEGSTLVLWVDGRRRAEVDPVFNWGEVAKPKRPFRREETEFVVPPLSQSVVDEVEAKVGLRSPAVIIADSGKPAPDLRAEIDDKARYYRDKRYLEVTDPRQEVVNLLTEAHADLNRAALGGTLDHTANEARFLCGQALHEMEQALPGRAKPFSDRAAAAVRNAARALHEHDKTGQSLILAYSVETYSARHKCDLALEHVEKSLADRRPRARERDVDRER